MEKLENSDSGGSALVFNEMPSDLPEMSIGRLLLPDALLCKLTTKQAKTVNSYLTL